MGLESGSKKRSLEAGRFGYEEIKKERWEGITTYNDNSVKNDNGRDDLQKLLDKLHDLSDSDSEIKLTFDQKKEKLINTLNNHFGNNNQFTEMETISNDDMIKIINLYEQEASEDGKDPWYYLYFDDLIIMQKCVYDIIKDIPKYSNITEKLEKLYEDELNRRLKRYVHDYGEETDKTYQQSYAKMSKYSLTLADMKQRKIQRILSQVSDMKNVVQLEEVISDYEKIKLDLETAGIILPESYGNNVAKAKNKLNNHNIIENKLNSQSNEMKIDAMIDAMVNGELDTNGQPIIQTENQNSNTKIMGFTASKMLVLVSFVFCGLILIIGTIAISFMK